MQECGCICVVNIDRYAQFRSNIDTPVDFFVNNIGLFCNIMLHYSCAHVRTVDIENCDEDVSQTAKLGALITDENIYIALTGHTSPCLILMC